MRNLKHLEKYRLRDEERRFYGGNGDEHNGMFKVFVKGKGFFVIASNGGGWEHVSVSRSSGKASCPTWNEMCAIKDMFFDPEEAVVQYHPKKSEYVNNHNYCLHLWRPIFQELPTPPNYMVGVLAHITHKE